jgi:hypothetical protein
MKGDFCFVFLTLTSLMIYTNIYTKKRMRYKVDEVEHKYFVSLQSFNSM